MTTVTGSDLGLGVIFTGKVDITFKRAVDKLRSSILELTNLQKNFAANQKAAKAAMSSGGSELTERAKLLGNATNETKAYQTALANLTKKHGEGTTALNVQKKALNATERSIQTYASSLRNTSKWQSNGKIIADRFVESIDREAVMRTKSAVASQKAVGVQREVQSAIQKTTDATKRSSEQYQGFNKQLSRVHGGMERVKAAFKVTASYGLASTAIYSVVTALKSGVREIVNFDQALKNLEAISGGTTAQIRAMKSTIEDIANTTKFSTTEIAQGMVLLSQAGLSAEEAIDAMQAVANLATGTLSNMATTADLMTTSLRAFELKAVQAGRISDVMANAINKSKLTVDKLRIAFNFVGAAAAQTGLSIEETATSMSILANSGLRASTIGTGLRQALARLLAPSGKLKEAFKSHGIVLDEVNPRIVGFQQAFKTLAPLLLDSKKGVIDMGKAYQLFGLRGAQAAAVLAKAFLTKGEGGFDEMYEKINKVGTAEEMMGIQAEGLAVKIKNLSDKAGLLALAIGDAGAGGAIGSFIDQLRGITELITTFAKTIGGEFLISIGLWTTAIWASVAAFTALATIIKTSTLYLSLHNMAMVFDILIRKTGALSASFSMLGSIVKAHPLLFIMVGVGTLIAGFRILDNAFKRSIKQFQQQAIEGNRVAGSLKVYSGALKSLNEKLSKGENVGAEYRAMVERLTHEHPRLATMVDLTTASYEELTGAIKKLIKINEDKVFASQAKEIDKYKERIKLLGDELDHENTSLKTAIRYLTSSRDLADTAKEHEEYVGKLASTIASYTLSLRDKVISEEISLAQAKQQIKEDFARADSIDEVTKSLLESIKVYKKREEIRIAEAKLSDHLTDREQKAFDRIKKFQAEQLGALAKNEAAKKELYVRAKSDKERVAIIAEFAQKEELIRKETAQKMEELSINSIEIMGREVEAIEMKIKSLQKEKALIEARKDKGEDKDLALAKNQFQILEQERKLTEVNYKNRLTTVQKYSDEYMVIMEEMYKAKLFSEQEWLDHLKNTAKYEVDIAKQKYDRKLISAEDYYAKLKELNKKDPSQLSDIELAEKKTELLGSAYQNLELGLKRAALESKTFSQTMLDVGESLPVEMTNNLTDSLFDYVDGTKNAKEAFKDFAKNTLRWLAELIVKQEVYNTLAGSDGKGGLVSGVVGLVSNIATSFATGGWIREPVIGRGVNSGRTYTIAEKGPEYVSPNGAVTQQSQIPPSVYINIENKTDSKIKSKETGMKYDGKNWVTSVVLETLNNNSGYKNSMKSALAR